MADSSSGTILSRVIIIVLAGMIVSISAEQLRKSHLRKHGNSGPTSWAAALHGDVDIARPSIAKRVDEQHSEAKAQMKPSQNSKETQGEGQGESHSELNSLVDRLLE